MRENPRTILVAEDDAESRNCLEMFLRCQGYDVELAQDGEEALVCLGDSTRDISLVLLDIMMPRKDGLETLREIRQQDRNLPIIMLSGVSHRLNVVEAMKSGATDFLDKPWDNAELSQAIQKALRISVGGLADEAFANPLAGQEAFVSGNSRMKKIEQALRQIGASDVPVLLQGESGVGKEVLARQLHAQSPRANKPFLKLNCVALPSELLESELFGYERGAFTGAFKNKPGKFELADGGTVLLDEIGDMDFKLQAKLLQVLQDHEFQRLGGKEMVRVNVRVLAATHRDLEKAMRDGHFREDLYYRLNVINIQVPALRDRRDEIVPLAAFFLNKHASTGQSIPEVTSVLRRALLAHDWPGNIRELENVMRKFLVFRDPEMLAEEVRYKTRRRETEVADSADPPVNGDRRPSGLETVEEANSNAAAEAIIQALNSTRWNRKQAAALLNIDYKALLYKMQKLGIQDRRQPVATEPGPNGETQLQAPTLRQVDDTRRQAETEVILNTLISTHWNRKRAAELLHMDYKALLYRMKKLEIVAKPPAAAEPSPADQSPQDAGQPEAQAILATLESVHWNRRQAAALLNLDYKALLYKMRKLNLGEGRPEAALDQ